MLNRNHTSLSDEQKLLVDAFNQAADFLVKRVAQDAELDGTLFAFHGSIDDMGGHKHGQINSAITSEAQLLINIAADIDQDNIDYKEALRKAGLQTDKIYFYESIPAAPNERRQAVLMDAYRISIERELLTCAGELNALPKEYLMDELVPRLS